MEVSKQPKVSLVGAGPGSKDLITIRGLRTLQAADIVLYDALIDTDLLSEIAEHIPQIYVGKRCGRHAYTQEEINSLMVEKALVYGHVVRLKGGDPFVFGRAYEEIRHVQSFGIPVNVVPGVSSAIAVPSCQGIPLTHRNISSSFWVLTATQRDGSFSRDLKFAAQSDTTMVILMGIRKLREIIYEVNKYRASSTPFAIIQNGTLKNETCHIGTLGSVEHVMVDLVITCPGIILIGDVVAEHPTFFSVGVKRALHSNLQNI